LERFVRGGVFVEIADREIRTSGTDYVTAAVVALGESMERLAGGKFLTELAPECDARRWPECGQPSQLRGSVRRQRASVRPMFGALASRNFEPPNP